MSRKKKDDPCCPSLHSDPEVEYIHELEAFLSKIHEKDLQATLEFQAAERKTMEESRRLRTLLRQFGITDAELERYLSQPESATSNGDGSHNPSMSDNAVPGHQPSREQSS